MRSLLVALLVLTALLIGAPGAAASPRSCGLLSVELRAHEVHVYAANTRCRTARRLGRAWVRRDGCGDCRVKRWRCRDVRESTQVRCVRGTEPRRVVVLDEVIEGAAEPAARRVCGPVTLGPIEAVVVTAISATCATALRVGRRWGHKEACRDGRCRVRGWVCKPRGPRSRCARPERPRQTLELQRQVVIVD